LNIWKDTEIGRSECDNYAALVATDDLYRGETVSLLYVVTRLRCAKTDKPTEVLLLMKTLEDPRHIYMTVVPIPVYAEDEFCSLYINFWTYLRDGRDMSLLLELSRPTCT